MTRRQLVLILAAAMGIATGHAETYYWDNNGATGAFGTVGGTWSSSGTAGRATQGWSTDSSGATLPPGTITTSTADILNFGSSTAGFSAIGTAAISGTVNALSLNFGSANTAAVTLGSTSNTINLAGSGATITNNLAVLAGNTINAKLVTTGNLLFNGTNASVTSLNLGGVGSIGGSVTISGSNNLIVMGANNAFAGSTTISVNSGNTVRFDRAISVDSSTSYDLNGTGAGSRGALGFFNGAATSAISGAINLSGNTSIVNRDTLTLSGNITESGGSRSLTIFNSNTSGSSSATLSGNNTFSGSFILSDSGGATSTTKIKAGSTTAFGSGTLTMGSTTYTTGSAIIDLNGNAVSVGGLTGGANAGHFIQNGSATSGTLTVNQSANTTFAGVIRDNTGTVALTKSGSGSLTLSGNNTYNGGTNVTAGTLALSGSGSINNSALSVSSGAIFTNASSVVFSNALTVAEGARFTGTTAAFTPTSLTISGDLGDGFTTLNFVSSLTKAGLLTANLSNTAVGTYNLISSATTGSFSSVTVSGTTLTSNDGGATFGGSDNSLFNYAFDNSSNTLSVSAIPEPSTFAALAGLGVLGMAVYRRRTNRV